VLISAVQPPDLKLLAQYGVRGSFFLVDVTRACLDQIGELIEASVLSTKVGTVLPLEEARTAHLMLEVSRARPRVKPRLTPHFHLETGHAREMLEIFRDHCHMLGYCMCRNKKIHIPDRLAATF